MGIAKIVISAISKLCLSVTVWGYGFLFVTLINICSLTGFIVLPFIKKDFYSYLLMFLIALAVGSLVASALLVLIPEVGLGENTNILKSPCFPVYSMIN